MKKQLLDILTQDFQLPEKSVEKFVEQMQEFHDLESLRKSAELLLLDMVLEEPVLEAQTKSV